MLSDAVNNSGVVGSTPSTQGGDERHRSFPTSSCRIKTQNCSSGGGRCLFQAKYFDILKAGSPPSDLPPFHFLVAWELTIQGERQPFLFLLQNLLFTTFILKPHHCLCAGRNEVTNSKQRRERRNIYLVLVGGFKNSLAYNTS